MDVILSESKTGAMPSGLQHGSHLFSVWSHHLWNGLSSLVHSLRNGLFDFSECPRWKRSPAPSKTGNDSGEQMLCPSRRLRARSSLCAGCVPVGLDLCEAERGPVVRLGEVTCTCLMTVTSPALHVDPDARPWNSEPLLLSIYSCWSRGVSEGRHVTWKLCPRSPHCNYFLDCFLKVLFTGAANLATVRLSFKEKLILNLC